MNAPLEQVDAVKTALTHLVCTSAAVEVDTSWPQIKEAAVVLPSSLVVCKHPQIITMFSPDINECIAGTRGCSHSCINLPGSFQCSCRIGYQLASDGRGCDGMMIIIIILPYP